MKSIKLSLRKIPFFASIIFSVFSSSTYAQTPSESTLLAPPKVKYFCEVNGGYLAGNEIRSMFHVKNGLSFGSHFDAAFGVGLESYYSGRYVPLFLEGRYTVFNRKTSPFIAVSGGYLQGVGQQNQYYYQADSRLSSGFSTGAKVGIKHQFSKSISLVTSMGYRYSYTENAEMMYYILPYPNQQAEISYNMNRFELAIGFIFH